MTSTARVRAHRLRAAAGRAILRLEADEDELANVLIASGLLDPTAADDPAEISAALVRQLAVLGWLAQRAPGVLLLLRRMAEC